MWFRIVILFAFLFFSFSHSALATGDCDSNGIVTISEVQSAIDMFLGLKDSAPCNENLSGSVGLLDVQKSINVFHEIIPVENQVTLIEIKQIKEAAATPGTSLYFMLSGAANNGFQILWLTGMFTSTIDHPVTNNSQQFNVRQDNISVKNTATGQSLSSAATSYVTPAGYLNSLEQNGLQIGTVSSQTLLPATAAIGDSGSYATISYIDGTVDAITWSIEAGINGDAVIKFRTITVDSSNTTLSFDDEAYTIKPDGTITALAIEIHDLTENIIIALSGARVINAPVSSVTHEASNITDTSVQLEGSFANPLGTDTFVYFEYGTTTSYGNTTNPETYPRAVTTQTNFSAKVQNLQPMTTYHIRSVTSTDGHKFYGADKTFTTLMAPQIVVKDLNSATKLALDSTNIYWYEGSRISKTGKNGGPVTTLASGVDAIVLAVDSSGVYWREYNGSVNKVDLTGGTITTLASSLGNDPSIALSDTNVYWPAFGIMTVGKSGGVPKTIVPSPLAYPSAVAVRADSIYWIDYGVIKKSNINGHSVTTLATGEYYAHGIYADSSGVYWSRSGGIRKYSETDGAVSSVAPPISGNTIYDFALDATNVYWIENRELRRVGKNGGAITTLASIPYESTLFAIAVDDVNVYWVEQNLTKGGSMIKSIPKNYK